MKLTQHFTLEELTFSQEAVRRGIPNEPPPAIRRNLEMLARTLEDVRMLVGGTPLSISSGYRCQELNEAIGGSKNSAHMQGLAADFTAWQYGSPKDIAMAISHSHIPFDQVIWEGTWVHLGLRPTANRSEVLTAHFDHGTVRYTEGLA